MRAGVFDSGVGGLSVVKSLINEKLFSQIIYYGDTARVPYGTKDKNTIIGYSLETLEFFKNFDLDIIIVACNTASAYALDELRANTSIPVVGVIESGVLALDAHNTSKDDNILVIGTNATIGSKLYEKSLRQKGFNNITSKATPLLVPLVEENIYNGAILNEVMKMYFKDIKDIDTIILGCTHFPLIQNEISRYFNGAKTIHSGDAIVELLKTQYNVKTNKNEAKITFFASSNPDALKDVAMKWFNLS